MLLYQWSAQWHGSAEVAFACRSMADSTFATLGSFIIMSFSLSSFLFACGCFFFFLCKRKTLDEFFFVFSCEVNSVLFFFCHFTCFNLSVVQSPFFVFFFSLFCTYSSLSQGRTVYGFFFLIAALSFTYKRVSRACLFAITFFFSSLHFCIYIYFFFLSFFLPCWSACEVLERWILQGFFFWKDYPDQFCIPARPLSYPCVFFFFVTLVSLRAFFLWTPHLPLYRLSFFFSLLTPSALLLVLLCSFYHFSFSFSFFTQRNARKELSLLVRSHRFVLEFQALPRRSLFFFSCFSLPALPF